MNDQTTLLPAQGARRTSDERREVAAAFLVTGNADATARLTGIPARTIRNWTNEPWWPSLMAEVRLEKQNELDAALSVVINSAVAAIEDRIAGGDHVFVNGELRRKPIAARDLALVTGICYDKRALLRSQPTQIVANSVDRLELLAQRLLALNRRPLERAVETVIEAECEG